MSRIDPILISRSLFPMLEAVGFYPRTLSDHAPYWVVLKFDSPLNTYTWKLSPFWLSVVPGLDEIGVEWDIFFQTNRNSAPFEVVWDSFKSHAHMTLAQRITKYKKNSSHALKQAEQALTVIEREFSSNPTHFNADQLKQQTRIVSNMHFEKAERNIFYAKQRLYECGERAGRLLAYLAHMDLRPPTVVSLQSTNGEMISEPDRVAGEFRSYFMSLYTSTVDNTSEDTEALLSTVELPTLSQPHIEMLEAPISTDDIAEAMSHLKVSKAPDPMASPLNSIKLMQIILSLGYTSYSPICSNLDLFLNL